MKDEVEKGMYWGAGVGTGLSLIALVWILGVNIFNRDKLYQGWEEFDAHNFEVAEHTFRFSKNRNGEKLVITGHTSGGVTSDTNGMRSLVWVRAEIFNADGVFLQRCSESYAVEYLAAERRGFILECFDLSQDSEIGEIKFEVDVGVQNADS